MRVLSLAISLMVCITFGESSDAVSKPSTRGLPLGSEAPQFTLKTLNPKLSKHRMFSSRKWFGPKREVSSKGLALTFGASYCEPCKRELSVLAKKSKDIRQAGYFLTAVIIDREKEGIEEMRKLLVEKLGFNFPALSDRFGILARRYKAETLPMMIVVGPEGKIIWSHAGYEKSALTQFLKKMGTKP